VRRVGSSSWFQALCSSSTVSYASLPHGFSLVWLVIALGPPWRGWALAQQDPCEVLLNAMTTGWGDTNGVFFEDLFPTLSDYSHCISGDDHCQDAPALCSERDCDAEYDVFKWMEALFVAPGAHGLYADVRDVYSFTAVSAWCPLTCQVCGPERNVKPIVTDILRGPCEHGWSYADGVCFKYAHGMDDGVSRILLNWGQAEDACQAQGAHLATVATKAAERLVFDLIRQRPAHLGSLGLWAWIGLWTGPMACSHNSSNWTWIGAPQPISMPHSFFPTTCSREWMHVEHAMHTNSIIRGDTGDFSSARVTERRRAWICSKPALFHTVRGGLCQDAGLLPILDFEACAAAAKVLMGTSPIAFRSTRSPKHFGCSTPIVQQGVWLNTLPANQPVRASQDTTLLCQSVNTTGQRVNEPHELPSMWQGVHAGEPYPSLSQSALSTLLVASFLPVLMVLGLRRRDLVALMQRCLKCLCNRETSMGGYFIIVITRVRQWRRTITTVAAVAMGIFHLFELVMISFLEESVCTSDGALPQVRLCIACVHLGGIWVASLYLALTHQFEWAGSRPEWMFVFVIIMLDIAQAVIVREEALLVESRLYRQLFWRLVLGSCTSPAIALLGNLLHVTGTGIAYKMLIPDGFIFTVGSTGAGFLYQQGCNQLWSQQDALTGKALLDSVSRLKGILDVSAMDNFMSLVDELLKKQTSFTDFLHSEIILVAIVMLILVCVDTLLFQAVSKSLQLQSTEDQILALSHILDRICGATCQLSRSFSIKTCSPQLGAILRMSAGRPALEGVDFCSIIASEDDRARFRAFIAQGIRDGFTEALQLDLMGASNTRVWMQLLCAPFTSVSGYLRILCGLTELEADMRYDSVGSLEAPRTWSTRDQDGGGRSATRNRRRARSRSAGSSSSSTSESESQNETRCRLDLLLDDNLSYIHANKELLDSLGTWPNASRQASCRLLLADPEVFTESMGRWLSESTSSNEFEAPLVRHMSMTFNRFAEQCGEVRSRPFKVPCRVELRKRPDSTLYSARLEFAVSRHRGSPLPASSSCPRSSGAEQLQPEQTGLEAESQGPSPSICGKARL